MTPQAYYMYVEDGIGTGDNGMCCFLTAGSKKPAAMSGLLNIPIYLRDVGTNASMSPITKADNNAPIIVTLK